MPDPKPDPKPGILRNLHIKRVALVDSGANLDTKTGDGAHIMLYKSAPSIGSVHVDTPNIKAAAHKTEEETKDKEITVKKSLMERLVGLWKMEDPAKRDAEAAEILKAFPDDDDNDKKPVHKADDAMCKCADCMAKVAKAAVEKKEEKAPVEKSAEIIAIEKRQVELEKANTELRAQLAVEVEKRLDSEMVDILKGFKATAFDMTKDVVVFRKMKKDSPEAFERTMLLMKAQDAQAAQSALYKDFGSRSGAGEGSAWAQIEAKADAMIEKSTTGNLTREQAIEKVMFANPKLVSQYRSEQQ